MGNRFDKVIGQIGEVVLGKEQQIRVALACLLARGHLLIEDLPGVGKTTLGQVIAQTLGLQFNRIQFTSDLLPADVLGASIYERNTQQFRFLPGPIFAQVVLADEINRATPKTQSALLEAMEEQQVTAEGETRSLPAPFFVIATQNPASQVGTFPLPESQLDRFLVCMALGYPHPQAERELLRGSNRRGRIAALPSCMGPEELALAQRAVEQVFVSDALLDYVQNLLTFSRESALFVTGLSPRAGLGLLNAARAWALLDDRHHVLPEDVQMLLPYVAGHRLQWSNGHTPGDTAELSACFREVALP